MSSNEYFSHKSAIISEHAKIGKNTRIWHFSHIREGASIGENVTIGQNVYIDSDVVIGDNCKIQNNVSIYNGVIIEKNVFIGPSVTFTNDLYPKVDGWSEERLTKTFVKEGSSIGANSTIVCGLTIHKNSLIGAGSVVTKDVEENSLTYGNPARFIKFL